MNSENGRNFSFFFIPATVIAVFALMVVGAIATLNHRPALTSSIETVLAGPSAPAQPEEVPSVAVAHAAKR